MKKTLIQVRNLAIGHKDRPLFADISFDICEGDVILLCGANGSGKTTLLKALTEIRSEVEIAMIPTRIPKIKGFTLNEFINLSCYNKQNADSDKALKKLALSHLADRDISTLCEETGTAVIFSSHDLYEALETCNKVIALGADRQCHISSVNLKDTISAIFSKD